MLARVRELTGAAILMAVAALLAVALPARLAPNPSPASIRT
jgi:hypothetical protein